MVVSSGGGWIRGTVKETARAMTRATTLLAFAIRQITTWPNRQMAVCRFLAQTFASAPSARTNMTAMESFPVRESTTEINKATMKGWCRLAASRIQFGLTAVGSLPRPVAVGDLI